MRAASSFRRGFALPVTIVMMAVVAIVVAAVGGFVANAARQTRIHLARSRCRLAALCAIEEAKVEIREKFDDYAGGSGAASVKIDTKQAEVYNWFDEVSSDGKTIGKGDGTTAALADPTNGVNGCRVVVAAARRDEHGTVRPLATVPVVATAVCELPDGFRVTATIRERVVFGTGQSRVFDYAYFVNNYGWMSGNTITINGDMRANGNVSLSQATVNGRVYAAANDELGVRGEVTLSGSPQIKGQTDYRSAAGSRARPDKADYGVTGAYDAPKQSGTIRKPTYYDDPYDEDGKWSPVAVPGTGTRGATSGATIVNEGSDSLAMPFVSELENYVAYAQERKGTLTYPAYSYTDSLGTNRTVSGGTVFAHYTGTGPSGDATAADNGALVLVGTAANPIVIDGPVVVDSDVIIKGYVTGQGTIYSGRNIHIVGDVKYVNAPSWGHEDADDAAVESANAQKDMLGLVAKGNVVVGDYTYEKSSGYYSRESWHDSVDKYISGSSGSSVVHSYACDASDANIGYPSTFAGDYTAVEQVGGLSATLAATAPGGYEASSGQFGKVRTATVALDTYHDEPYYDRWGRYLGTRQVQDTVTTLQTKYDRRYYETVCDDAVLKSISEWGFSQIDAVMYNNHGTFGTLGRSGSYVNVNGSLVCRDEALIYTASGLRFNWDFRLRSKDGDDASPLGLPPGPQDPYVSEWLQVPDSLNPAFQETTP